MKNLFVNAVMSANGGPIAQGVWSVRNPGEAWCVTLISALRERCQHTVLWLRSPPTDIELESLHGGCWEVPPAVTTDRLLQTLYEGGWAMFFGDQILLSKVGALPAALPTKPAELRALIAEAAADYLIVSWYDDTEWLLVSKDE